MIDNSIYREDIKYVAGLDLPWEKLSNKSILITGASGLIGSFLIDALMEKNLHGLKCKVYALGRNLEKAKNRFERYWTSPFFEFVSHDINEPLELENADQVDFVVHLASNTHPVAYATDPIGTVTANIIGTNNLLKICGKTSCRTFLQFRILKMKFMEKTEEM